MCRFQADLNDCNGIRVKRLVAVNLTSTLDEDGASSARGAGVELRPPDAWSARDD